jgi:hypothetical protein
VPHATVLLSENTPPNPTRQHYCRELYKNEETAGALAGIIMLKLQGNVVRKIYFSNSLPNPTYASAHDAPA